MHEASNHGAALTVAVALAAGLIAQVIARHARLPGIIVLLGVGVLLGPSVAGWLDPSSLGEAMHMIVGFAVAVILFEGGMNLNLRRLRREQVAIRRLITVGALVTAIGGTLIGKFVLGWHWRESVLFGTLVIVTGPTVVTPLLRRLHVQKTVSTVLEAEGVLIDAVGAVVATVALEVALSPSGSEVAIGAVDVLATLGFGVAVGLAGGFALAFLLRFRDLIPEGLENVFTLSCVLALFQASGELFAESGIAAATVAGIVVGNSKTHIQRELLEFKEQLTVMFIGLLFILLAADVELDEVEALGWNGIIAVLLLMFVVRPLTVWASTWGTELRFRDKLFMAWIAPRGIIAAAVASLFAARLAQAGSTTGETLRAMVFLVIAITVLSAGLTGGLMARVLRLRRPMDQGWIILGANGVARTLAHQLRHAGQDVLLIDTNGGNCNQAEDEGLRVFYGNGLEESVLDRAQVETRAGVVGLTANAEVNRLFATKVKHYGGIKNLLAALDRTGPSEKMLKKFGGRIFGGVPFPRDAWGQRLGRNMATFLLWELKDATTEVRASREDADDALPLAKAPEGALVAMTWVQGEHVRPYDSSAKPKAGDRVGFLVDKAGSTAVADWLQALGWSFVAEISPLDPEPEPPEPLDESVRDLTPPHSRSAPA